MKQNPITLEVLEILDAIDRRGSFAKAAEELNKATSALSYATQKLEEQLGIGIFQRQGRRSVLTPAGRLVLDEGRKILAASTLLVDRARELANGWEPRLRIALESTVNFSRFFETLNEFLAAHPTLEVDVCESVLSGGWEALERGDVDLVVGCPGPVPLQKGFRSVPITGGGMLPVIAKHHPLSKLAGDAKAIATALNKIRRVVSHDTSTVDIARSAGLSGGRQILYVQTIDQKLEAIVAGLGIGHLPTYRIQGHLQRGQLIKLNLYSAGDTNYIAWNITSKGKALQAFSKKLIAQSW
tara:strand:- start:12323 stop:13216 length:894 start_codon:yes stop_codon:yes gene_type:complete